MKAPDSAAPYVGMRGWRLAFEGRGGPPVLTAVVQDEVWRPAEPLEATCLRGAHHGPTPVIGCTCGIYSSQRAHEVRRLLLRGRYSGVGPPEGPMCVGTVAQWGRVVLHETGARSQLAYPQTVYIPERWGRRDLRPVARRLQERYGIPVEPLSGELMAAWGTSDWDAVLAASRAEHDPRTWRDILR